VEGNLIIQEASYCSWQKSCDTDDSDDVHVDVRHRSENIHKMK